MWSARNYFSFLLVALVALSFINTRSGLAVTPTPTPTPWVADEELDGKKLTSPNIKSGLRYRFSNSKLVISAGEVVVAGSRIKIPTTELELEPSPVLSVQGEQLKLSIGKQRLLQGCAASKQDQQGISEALIKSSVNIFVVSDDDSKELLSPDRYFVDPNGYITLLSNGNTNNDLLVEADYQCYLSRLDKLEVTKAGEIKLLPGNPSICGPDAPPADPDAVALANVYFEKDQLPGIDNVFPIGTVPYNSAHEKLVSESQKALEPVRQKLVAGKPVAIVFWGDGVTVGYDADPGQSFVDRFVSQIKSEFPNTPLQTERFGLVNTNSLQRKSNFSEVMKSKHPDLVIIEFVEDLFQSESDLEPVYNEMLKRCSQLRVVPILCIPHWPTPSLVHATSWNNIAEKPYLSFLRSLSSKYQLGLADVSYRWQHLNSEGLSPKLMLRNGSRYPNNTGHQIYADELLRLFGSTGAPKLQ